MAELKKHPSKPVDGEGGAKKQPIAGGNAAVAGDAAVDGNPSATTEQGGVSTNWYAIPEFTPPVDIRSDYEKEQEVSPRWKWTEKDTMNPFWALRRLTAPQLKKEQNNMPEGKMKPQFNCEIVDRTCSNVLLCSLRGRVLNTTRIVTVPCITNTAPLREGEELLLEIPEQVKAQKEGKRTWQDIQRQQEKEREADAKKKRKLYAAMGKPTDKKK